MTGRPQMTFERLEALGVVLPDDPPEVRELYAGPPDALPQAPAGLPVIDYLTARDLARRGTAGDPREHALLLMLLAAREQGSLGVRMTAGPVADLLQSFVGSERAAALSGPLTKWWAAAEFTCPFVASVKPGVDPASFTGPQYRPVIRDGDTAAFHRYYLGHHAVRGALRARAGADAIGGLPADAALAVLFADVFDGNPLRSGEKSVQLNADQKTAVGLAVRRHLSIISGGPGTGKTSIVFTILRLLLRCGVPAARVRLAAPTGRAARRMTEAVNAGYGSLADTANPADAQLALIAAGKTLHGLLDYEVGSDSFRFDAANPLPADVVIVDEVSMVDVVLMARLLDAVPPTARLILLGDKDQLPSVDVGAVLSGLMPAGTATRVSAPTRKWLKSVAGVTVEPLPKSGPESDPIVPDDTVVVLKTNYRSQRHIQAIASAVNAGDVTVVDQLPELKLEKRSDTGKAVWPAAETLTPPGSPAGGGCWLLPAGERKAFERVLNVWAEFHFFSGSAGATYADLVAAVAKIPADELVDSDSVARLIDRIDRFRVLTLVREGVQGCEWVNAYLADRLRRKLDPWSDDTVFAGAPVMVTRNDHVRGVYNGDVGVCVRDAENALRVVFRVAGGVVTYAPDALPAHELAFAVTVHKAQGSEYDQVLLVLPTDAEHRMLGKEIIYTGITRAKTVAAVYGSADALRAGIARRFERQGGAVW